MLHLQEKEGQMLGSASMPLLYASGIAVRIPGVGGQAAIIRGVCGYLGPVFFTVCWVSLMHDV